MRPFYILFLLLTACTLQSEPETVEERPAELTLSASVTEGAPPLEVAFSTDVTPSATRYAWTLAGRTLSETAANLTYTFDAPGVYIVTATAETEVGRASDSVTITVTQKDVPPENPGEPTEGTLNVTQTPGGPAPWAVRYSVQAEGYGADAQVRVRCSAEGDLAYEENSAEEVTRAVCLHTAASERARVDVLVGEEVVDSLELPSNVTPPEEGVAFLGSWRYDSRGLSETFEITKGIEDEGESAEGAFKLFLIKLGGLDIAEFTFGGRTVVLTPIPEEDGSQVFFADVYGLRLERLD